MSKRPFLLTSLLSLLLVAQAATLCAEDKVWLDPNFTIRKKIDIDTSGLTDIVTAALALHDTRLRVAGRIAMGSAADPLLAAASQYADRGRCPALSVARERPQQRAAPWQRLRRASDEREVMLPR